MSNGPEFGSALDAARRLALKERVRLLDVLRAETIVEREDGLRLSVESLAEFKRARKLTGEGEPVSQWIASFEPGDVFFDIGANTGLLSLLAGRRHGGRVRVFAFEPAFDSFGALVRNVISNSLANVVTPLPVALFDANGVRPFHRSALGAGTALHAVGEPLDYTRRPFVPAAVHPVAAWRLDDLRLALDLPWPTRIKLDVDGFENRVLAGAVDVLAHGVRDLYVELVETEAGDGHCAQLTAFLAGYGYTQAHRVEHGAGDTFPRVLDVLFTRA